MENNMKTYNCPSCGAKIALRDINVKSDVMLCRACRWMWRNTSINGWFIGWRKDEEGSLGSCVWMKNMVQLPLKEFADSFFNVKKVSSHSFEESI